MSHAAELPLWAALPVALLLLLGAGLGLTGSIGLLRLRSFYDRVHAPTLGTTLGIGCILLASMLFFSVLQRWRRYLTSSMRRSWPLQRPLWTIAACSITKHGSRCLKHKFRNRKQRSAVF